MGTEVAENEVVETAETIEREAEETIEEGSAAVEDEESSTAIEDKEDSTYAEAEIIEEAAESSEDDSEDDEEEKEEEEDPERLSELEILPGKTAYINFYYTIDPEIEGMKDQKVDFSFAYTLEDEEGKQTKNTLRETFRYAVDALNLMTVTAGGEKGYVETGKEDEMLLEFDLGLMREVLEEAIEEELEKNENGDASAAEAKRASASELLVGWEDENGERPLGKKDPAVIKNLKCEVETFGVKLDKFKAVPVKDDDSFGTSLKCSFYVSRKTLPGTYYGRVNASYKIKGKSFHTTQGFKVVVKQETGEMELVGKIGDSEIIMTGPVSSFPKADELSLKVSESTQEQQEKVDEALQKKAEEEGSEISQYKALDIKLMADGVETEPEGDVQVRFKNVNLEKVDEKKEAEQEKAEEQSMVKKAVRKVMSLFSAGSEEEDAAAVAETETEVEAESKDSEDGKAEGSEEVAGEAVQSSENIKVLHLDEDAVVANEMKSEVQDNGDVVMDTDHFSIYIVVNVPNLSESEKVLIRIEHHAFIEQMKMENGVPVEVPSNVDKDIIIPSGAITNEKREALRKAYRNSILRPGATWSDGTAEEPNKYYETKDFEIYSADELELSNGAGTGLNYSIAVKNWSKVALGGHYIVDYIEFNGKKYNESNSNEIIELNQKKGNIIKIYYKPENELVKADVDFHDYNVTMTGNAPQNPQNEPNRDENGQAILEGCHKGIRTNRVGINNVHLKNGVYNESQNYDGNRIGVGIHPTTSSSTSSIWHGYSGEWNYRRKTTDLPDEKLEKGEITFGNKIDPGLFVKNSVTTKEIDENGNIIDYVAQKYISDYQLQFKRKGDNYVLTSVLDESGVPIETAKNLDVLEYTQVGYSSGLPLFSNLFWPMDNVSYGTGEIHDPLFGNNYGFDPNDEAMKKGNLNLKHNWYFGMRYDFEFTIGDYIGPMNYYFRGDDDFWIFMDGIHVKPVDLGGIHAAEGAYVDLRKWMEENVDMSNTNAPHHMSVFFMERGGTGSCCYMSFTIPNAISIPSTGSELTSKTVQKIWLDKEFENRPEEGIKVQLYQNNNDENAAKPFGKEETLKAEDWTFTWTGLPKYSEVGNNNLREYTVKEVDVPEDYAKALELEKNGITYITNVRLVDIDVSKIWEDGSNKLNSRPQNIEVQLYKKLIDFQPGIGAEGDSGVSNQNQEDWYSKNQYISPKENEDWEEVGAPVKLSGEANEWKYTWKNLPLYENTKEDYTGKWKKVIYTIGELNDSGYYKASYNANADKDKITFTITNTFKLTGKLPIYKKCIGLTEDEKKTFTFKMRELEKNGNMSWLPKTPNTSDSSIDVEVDGIDGTLINQFVIEYKSEDFGKAEQDGFWYKWYEIWEENTGQNFIYDDTHYVARMKISCTPQMCTATWDVENVYILEDGNLNKGQKFEINESSGNNNPNKEFALPFVNYKKADLEISKKVTKNGSTTKDFAFTAEITLPEGTDITRFKLPASTIPEGIYIENQDKSFTAGYENKGIIYGTNTIKVFFKLKHDSKVIIPVPIGSTVTIKEDESSHAGYNVSFEYNNSVIEGDSLTIPNIAPGSSTPISVTCTNAPGAVLPDTGGPGLLMMSRLGWMLLLLALLMAGMEIQFYGERRNRKTANVQREDSRGFDPDDY